MADEPKYEWLATFSLVVGYMYTVAWGVSFLGQIHLNWKLKNVKGCNFDFVIYNFTGFSFYAAYNTAAYIDEQNGNKYGFGIGGVEVNDIVFAYWSLMMTIITLSQCVMYERGENKVSLTCKIATPIYWAFVIMYLLIEYAFDAFDATSPYYNAWYMMSYFKIWISLTKYVPQAVMNYKRKSTVGWSIFNIFLDFTGGSLSFFQMVLDAINGVNNPFEGGSQGLNIVKFALSVISMIFDILFMVQHYVLYNPKKTGQNLHHKELTEDILKDQPFMSENEDSAYSGYKPVQA